MEHKIEQGTIIYGMKSQKYPSCPCYGIIITARCDIAQNKVPKYYYLIAVDAHTWFCSKHGYTVVYGKTIEERRKAIYSKAEELELDGYTLLSLSNEDLALVIDDKKQQFAGNSRERKKVVDLNTLIEQYSKIAQVETDDNHRKKAIKENTKVAFSYLRDIDSGKMHHYYFLPQAAYLDNDIKSKGLIVDLLEIKSLTLEDAKKIASPLSEISYERLPPLPTEEEISQTERIDDIIKRLRERSRLETTFWLENESDFVGIEGTIKSPWCEHLMQRFSNVFIRIGLDNPSENDFRTLIDDCCQED